ncbi:MAG: OB-fold nucleic acid binding domain-containing protein [Candidatus Aenigmatarchaeota archaeon]
MERLSILCIALSIIGLIGLFVFGYGYDTVMPISDITAEKEGMWVSVCGNLSGSNRSGNWFGTITDSTGQIRVVAFNMSLETGQRCVHGIVSIYKGDIEIIAKSYD